MIEAILARGLRGQMGLNGTLPWHDPADLLWFKQMTMGKVLIAGATTMKTLPPLPGRHIVCDSKDLHPLEYLDLYPEGVVVIGGPKTFGRWAPYIQRWHIGVVDYNGPADCWFNPLWLETGA